jgi:hypothetical protein
MLIGLHVFIMWRHSRHQGENLTNVYMCVGVCVILFIYFVVGVVDLCVYGNIVGCLQEKLIVFNSIFLIIGMLHLITICTIMVKGW